MRSLRPCPLVKMPATNGGITQLTRTDIQVRYSNLDEQHQVGNSVYMQYPDSGRVTFFEATTNSATIPANAAVSAKINFIGEIRFEGRVMVKTGCSAIGNKSAAIEQHIFCNDRLATAAQVETSA